MTDLARHPSGGDAGPDAGPGPADAGDVVEDDAAPAAPWASLRWALRTTVLAAFACTFLLELSGLVTAGLRWWVSTFWSISYLADTLVVWLVLVVLVGLTNRVMTSVGVVAGLALVVALVNRVKLSLRQEPFYPSDLDFVREPGFLTSMVSPGLLVGAAVALVLLLVGTMVLARRHERRLVAVWPAHLSLRGQLVAVVVRGLVVTLALALLVDTTRFNEPGNPWRALYEANGDRWRYWNQRTNYLANGFVGGFLYNMPAVAMATPPGYGEAVMDDVARRYERLAARVNAGRTGSLADTNVVLVLSESFTDPTQLEGFELDEDPIPRTRATMAETTSGTMLAQLYGGGTANMEFEVLTGQSIGLLAPQLLSPYQMLVPEHDAYPSAVGWFAAQGHRPIAVHPYSTGMYKRQQVYRTFGFEEFVHAGTMRETDTLGRSEFISDESAFREVEARIADSDDPLLVNLVTMQNHIPQQDLYDDPIGVSGVDGDQAERIGTYARGLAHTDEALAGFLERLAAGAEDTVVLFYGDHLPGLYDAEVRDANPGLGLYRTPFLLWSSTGGTAPRTLPVTSPIHFLPLLHDLVDAPVPPYYALLQRLRHHVSALEQGRMLAPDGEQVTEDDLSPAGRQVLEDARLVQYDFSIGERHALDRLWPGAAG